MKVGDLKVVLKLAIDKFKSGLLKAKAQMSAFKSSLSKAALRMKRAFTSLLPAIKRIGLVAGVAFAAAGIASARFEEQIQRTAVILGNGARVGAAEFKKLTDKARELGRETLFSSTQAAKGMKILAKAGFSTNEVLNVIGNTIDLAVAQETDLERATAVLAATMRQFSIEASDSARVADVLTVAANSAMITVDGLGEAMKFAAPVAAALNNNLEDTAAVMAATAKFGLDASQIGTGYRRMLTRLINPSTEAQLAMKKLNINIDDGTGKMKPAIQILGELQKKFKEGTMTQIEFAKAIAEVGGTRGITMLINLATNAGINLDEMSKKMNNSKGAAKSMAQQFRETTIGRLKDFLAALQELAITLIGAFGNSIQTTIFAIRNFTLEIEKSLREGGRLKIVIDGIKEGLQPLKDLFKRTGEAMIKWLQEADPHLAAETFKSFFLDISESIVNLAEALGTLPWSDMIKGLTMATQGASMLLKVLTKIIEILAKIPGFGMTGFGGFGSKIGEELAKRGRQSFESAGTKPRETFTAEEAFGGGSELKFGITDFIKDLFTKTKQAQEEITQASDAQEQAVEDMKEAVVGGQEETSENIKEIGVTVRDQIANSGQVLGETLTNLSRDTSATLNEVEIDVTRSGQLNMQAISSLATAYENLNNKMKLITQRIEKISQRGTK